MFHKLIISLVTGQYASRVSTMHWWQIPAGISLLQGYFGSKAAKASGRAQQEAAYANAADLREFAGINANLLLGAANRNAEAQLVIGEANASAVERATLRNLMLYGMQADEEIRRHIYGERMAAGRVRAMVGAAGVQTNTGTPLMFLYEQVDEGIRQRKFMVAKHDQTMWTMAEEGKDKAGIMRLTASENAAVIMSNAEAQAHVSVLDAERQAKSLERSGQVAYATGQAQGTAALLSGIAGAVGSYAQWSAANSPTSLANNWNSPSFGWQSSGWGGNTGIGPQASFTNPGIQSGFTVGGRNIGWGN